MLGGHQPKFYAIAALALVAVAGPPHRVGRAGVTVALPPGWHSTRPVQGAVTNPLTRLAVASGPIGPKLTGRCDAQVASYRIPATAVAVVVVEWTKSLSGLKVGVGPPRPQHFALPMHPAPSIDCWSGPGGGTEWAEKGRSFAAYVLLGRRAPASLAAKARAVLDTLKVSRR